MARQWLHSPLSQSVSLSLTANQWCMLSGHVFTVLLFSGATSVHSHDVVVTAVLSLLVLLCLASASSQTMTIDLQIVHSATAHTAPVFVVKMFHLFTS